MTSRLLSVGVVATTIGLSVASRFLYNVDGGERYLIFDTFRGGIQDKVREEGTHVYIPIIQKPVKFDVRITPKVITTVTGSRDLQTVELSLRVLYRPDLSKLKFLYQKYGENYAETILPSIGNEVLKAVVAQFDAGELITQREEVSTKITQDLEKRANEFGILLADVSITHLEFSEDYMRAVEKKQVAQQYAERQKFLVEKATQEKEAEVILAQGETEAAELIMESMATGNEFLELRKIEAAKAIARTLSYSSGVSYIPSSGNMLLNIGSNAPLPRRVRPESQDN